MLLKIFCINILISVVTICDCVILRKASFDTSKSEEEISKDFLNRDHIRRKRFLGLNKKFKLNKLYQECVGPGDAKGHCKHLSFCPIDVLTGTKGPLEYLCVIEKTFVGVCCPDDVALSGMVGSQLIMDLPAGGEDYEERDNITGCGIPAEGRSTKVMGSIRLQQWPWLAALYHKKEFQTRQEQQFCGGSVITDTHILTAAHCLQGVSPQEINVRLGEYDFSKLNETRFRDYAVAEITNHEDFELSTYENDIAIIRLAQPMTFNSYIWPICLPPTGESFENESAVVAGWGHKEYTGNDSQVLLQTTIPVWNQKLCQDSFLQRITDHNLCAADYEGGKDSCQGDSGGPLMYQLKNGRWITIGIVSWGIECGNKGSPGIYTRLNRYLPWIIKNTIAKA